MACVSGSNITDDGLIFHMDFGNTSKSWRGVPTTNLYQLNSGLSDLNDFNDWGMPGVPGGTTEITNAYGSWKGSSIWRVNSTSGTTQSYMSWRQCIPGFTGAYPSTRRLQAKVKMLRGNISDLGIHSGGGTSSAGYIPIDPEDIPDGVDDRSGWYLLTAQVNFTGGGSHCVGIGILSADIEFLVAEPGVFSNVSVTVPYTSSTLSDTSSVLDVSKSQSEITATNLSYQPGEIPEFDGIDTYMDADLSEQSKIYCLDFWLYNNFLINNNDGSQGSSGGAPYQTLLSFNRIDTGPGVAFGGWTGTATNEAIHIWGNYPGAGNDSTMTYTRDAVPIGWHNISFNWNGSDYDIWVDGVKSTTYPRGGSGHATLIEAYNMRIGRNYTGNYYFDGKLSSMKLYNKQLTDQEVKRNFEATRSRYGI